MMKIRLEQLTIDEPLTVTVTGDEEWLTPLYGQFPTPAGQKREALTAHLEVLRLEGDFVQVSGRFDFAPYLACSRCNQPITWPLHENISVCFMPEPPQAYPSERDLTPVELDEYNLEDGAFDLEALLNEAVVLAIPSRTYRSGHDNGSGEACEDGDDEGCVYTTTPEEEEEGPAVNPFAVLKGLKLDD